MSHTLRLKLLAARLSRPAPADRECIPSIVVALAVARAARRESK